MLVGILAEQYRFKFRKARCTAEHSAKDRPALTTSSHPASEVSSAEVKKPRVR